ncbi:Mitogen-activated protein kinase 12 [Coemansia asiatica]|uniref:Mitogen-activated protein kinase 12 n=1 Tax=Coemansia asiatica TaxID=1052880 RepID=A0A9W8CH13_9FUNG|nr:Mitogen-activated protein kinase 12 [Coemansia asiatica]
MATVSIKHNDESDCFFIDGIVDREVSLHGRIAYIVKGKFGGKAAVLKLSWTSVDRLAENAVYEILLRDNIKGIPEMFRRGLLIEDFGGFRLEFIIMENCGDSLSKALSIIPRGDKKAFTDAVKSMVRQTTASLISANISGIIHRDISDGNIAVRLYRSDKPIDARIIDWGYAKDRYYASEESEKVAKKWHYDSLNVGSNEKKHDPFTGTPRYMSISTLFGSTSRSVITDIESLFHVVLDALRTIFPTPKGDEKDQGFGHYPQVVKLGFMRIACISFDKDWLANFGIEKAILPSDLVKMLEVMRSFLFFDRGRFIGTDLASNPKYEYDDIDTESAKFFMDEEIIRLLQEGPTSSLQSSPVVPLGSQTRSTIQNLLPLPEENEDSQPLSDENVTPQSSPVGRGKRKAAVVAAAQPETSKRQRHTTDSQRGQGGPLRRRQPAKKKRSS